MKLKRISAVGFKIPSFDTPLTPVTIIRGLNYIGKSARIECLEWIMSNAIKGIDSRPAMLHGTLCNGDVMSGTVETDTGSIFRSLTKKGEKVTAAARFIGFKEGYTADPILFSPAEFLGLSGPAKLKYLFNVLPPPPAAKVGATAIATKIKNITLDPHTEDATNAVNVWSQFVQDDYNGAKIGKGTVAEFTEYLNDTEVIDKKFAKAYLADSLPGALVTVQDWLALLCEQVRVKANAASAQALQMRNTIMGVTQLKPLDAGLLGQAEAVKRTAQGALTTAGTALATAREKYKSKKAELDEATTTANSYVAPEEGAKERLEEKVKELETKLAHPAKVADEKFAAKLKEVKAALEPLQQKRNQFVSTKATVLANATNKEGQVKTLQQQYAEFEEHTKCPVCKAKGQKWKDEALAEIQGRINASNREVEELAKQLAIAINSFEEVDKAIAKLQKSAGEISKQQEEDAVTVRADSQQRETDGNLLRVTNSQIQALKDTAALAEPARLAKAKLPVLQAAVEAVKLNGEQLVEAQRVAKVAFDEADTAHRKAVADNASAKTAADAAKAADKADAQAQVAKEVLGILENLLRECVEDSVKPLLTAVNALCSGILTAPVVLHKQMLGLERQGHFIPCKSPPASDSEMMLMSAALSLALAGYNKEGGIRLAVIGRFESLDYVQRLAFVERVLELVKSGKLDNCIIIEVAAQTGNPYSGIKDKAFSVVEV